MNKKTKNNSALVLPKTFPSDSEITSMSNSTVYIRDSNEIKMVYPDMDEKYHILFSDGHVVKNISTLAAKKCACIANHNIICETRKRNIY